MTEIHRKILNRLLAAWTAISLVVGGGAFTLGMQKVDDQLVALAAEESAKLSSESLPALREPAHKIGRASCRERV